MSCTGETNSAKNEMESTCPICLQLFSEPMSLPCGHIYCLPCLQTMSAGLDLNNCPECQQEYAGTDALVKNMKMCSMDEAHKATLGSDVNANKSYLDCANEMAPTEHREGTSGPLPKYMGMDMDELKFRLAFQVTELTVRVDRAEYVLRKEKEREEEVRAANVELRAAAAKLLHDIQALSLNYSEAVTRLIEGELSPGEGTLSARVSQASQLTEQLRHAVLNAESLLTEDDHTTFTEGLNLLQSRIAHLMDQLRAGEEAEPAIVSKINASLACAKLEETNADFTAGTGDIHRALRNLLNPSEVTFDPDTAHPNLVLSGDMKTVTYNAARQAYPSSPQRFTSFLQVLSKQSFSGGEHCWRVELEGSPWAVGMCYAEELARSGMPSALESSRSSWCLMWFENRLRAFERGRDVPLKLTTMSRTLEVRLSFKSHRLSFYNVHLSGEKTHVYTFEAVPTEPVHLAYRMMSAHPKARVTIGEASL